MDLGVMLENMLGVAKERLRVRHTHCIRYVDEGTELDDYSLEADEVSSDDAKPLLVFYDHILPLQHFQV